MNKLKQLEKRLEELQNAKSNFNDMLYLQLAILKEKEILAGKNKISYGRGHNNAPHRTLGRQLCIKGIMPE